MTELQRRPAAGDWVDYTHPTGGGQKQRPRAHSYRTGRVLERLGDRELRVLRPCQKLACVSDGDPTCMHDRPVVRVPLDHVVGWWPKGTTNRSPQNRREGTL